MIKNLKKIVDFNSLEVIFVPTYLSSALKRAKVDFEELVLLKNSYDSKTLGEFVYLSKYMNLEDVRDLITINYIINKALHRTDRSFTGYLKTSEPRYLEYNKEEITKVLVDLNVNNNTLLMTESEQHKLFTVKCYNNLMVVEFSNGFLNGIVYRDDDYIENLSICLMDYMFKYYEASFVEQSIYPGTFIGLKNRK